MLVGPTYARTLAEHGADAMKVSRDGLAVSGMFDLDTDLGKHFTCVDLRGSPGLKMPPRWGRPAAPLGHDAPAWAPWP